MNSDVEPNPQPPPASSSPDEVASSLDKISISSNNNMIHPTNQEDTPMTEASSSNNNAETLSPEDFINKLHSQKAAMLKIIDSINDENIQFVMQNNFEGLESNDKKLSFATKSLERFDKLIADQVNIISLNSAIKETPVSCHINNMYIPSKELPKFNVNPTASAMYQLTQHSESSKELSGIIMSQFKTIGYQTWKFALNLATIISTTTGFAAMSKSLLLN
ncbi:hypothetical protein G6F60_013476 [Rhizopus arrhizus]|nr:hypothetical protein G6F60_013476 [Rhizopus arrhizus]